jgi:CRISPR-associated protein (TIGR02584 family)
MPSLFTQTQKNPAPALPLEQTPERYPRRVLLCMAGLTPATITETLYALVVPPKAAPAASTAQDADETAGSQATRQGTGWLGALGGQELPDLGAWRPTRKRRVPRPFAPFVPTEIHLITTLDGQQAMMGPHASLDEPTLRQAIVQLMDEYPEHFGEDTAIEFGPQNVHLICRADGTPVNDFATEADSEATGNAILGVLRDLVADGDCAIHASYAGGRKSMGAMLVLAMSLLGRKQDRLSQVLIPAAFEGKPFLYPPAKPTTMVIRNKTVNTRDAHVTLAPLPLLRVFDGLGVKLLDPSLGLEDVIELGEMALEKRAIIVKPLTQTVQIGHLVCRLSPGQIGLYTLLAVRRAAGAVVPGDEKARAGGVRWQGSTEGKPAAGFDPDDRLYRQAAARFGLLFDPNPVPDGSVSLKSTVSKLNSRLVEAFGPELAEQALIEGPAKGTRGDGIYGLFNADVLHLSA